MPFVDNTSVVGGYGQIISDWALGDDRIFYGVAPGLPGGIPVVDNNLTDAYFTLKSSPNVPDANSIVQLHITPIASSSGQITLVAGAANNLLFSLFSAQIEGLVNVGPVYYWDFRVVTGNGRTITIATGTVVFVQNTTQTNVAGTPAALPNNGLPRFRGFLPTHPKNISNFTGVFNPGDYYRNSRPTPGGPSGWVCIVACSNSSGFVTDGVVGNT